MPITELAVLQLLPPHKFRFSYILEFFQAVGTRQSAVSNFPLYFFEDTANESIIYLISGWNDVDSHMKWIESKANQELLRLSVPYLKVLRLLHLDVDFTGAEVRDATMVVVKKYEDESDSKIEYIRDIPSWKGVGVDLESESDQTKYEIFAYDKGKAAPGIREKPEGTDDTMMMTRLTLSGDDQTAART